MVLVLLVVVLIETPKDVTLSGSQLDVQLFDGFVRGTLRLLPFPAKGYPQRSKRSLKKSMKTTLLMLCTSFTFSRIRSLFSSESML